MELCQEGLDNLRCAIIELAAKDYLDYKKSLHKIDKYGKTYHEHDRKWFEYQLESVVNFFQSQWYTTLCSIDCEYLIRKLNEEFEEWRTEYDKKQAKKRKKPD